MSSVSSPTSAASSARRGGCCSAGPAGARCRGWLVRSATAAASRRSRRASPVPSASGSGVALVACAPRCGSRAAGERCCTRGRTPPVHRLASSRQRACLRSSRVQRSTSSSRSRRLRVAPRGAALTALVIWPVRLVAGGRFQSATMSSSASRSVRSGGCEHQSGGATQAHHLPSPAGSRAERCWSMM